MLKAQTFCSALVLGLLGACDNDTASPNSSSSGISQSSVSNSSQASSSSDVLVPSSSSSLSSSSLLTTTGTVVDSRDGKTYKTTKIGTQVWMAENLNYGAMIARMGDWKLGADQKICNSNNESSCKDYGGYYDWSTALALPDSCDTTLCAEQIQPKHRGICPAGSHLPTYEEWRVLFSYLEKGTPGASGDPGSWDAGAKLKAQFTGFAEWDDSKTNLGSVTDFNAIPSPWYTGTFFGPKGSTASFLSVYEKSAKEGDDVMISAGSKTITRSGPSKQSLYQIRCLLD